MMMLFSLWCLAIDDCALFYFLCLQVTTLVGHDDAVQSVVFDIRLLCIVFIFFVFR